MNQVSARTPHADLRLAVLALSPSLAGKGPATFAPLVPGFQRLLRRLTRAAGCPDLDNLADALRATDELQAAVESLHVGRPVAGIARLRQAFAAIEAWVDGVGLAAPVQETAPDVALDIPQAGLLATLLARRVLPPTAASRVRAVVVLPELRRAA